MSLLIAGGTGFIGRSLTQFYRSKGLKVFIVTRNAKTKDELTWGDINSNGIPNNVKAVINLCGRGIAEFSPFFLIDKLISNIYLICLLRIVRYYQQFKNDIVDSRINTTKTLIDIVRKSSIRPEIFINASAIGFYKPSLTETYTENYSRVDHDLLSKVCKDWEDAAQAPDILDMRTIQLRIGLVMGSGGGMLKQMHIPYICGLGGPIGSGDQWTSWIHIDDIIGIIDHAINNELINGPINGTAPNPVRFREFSETLGRTLHRPTFLSVPEFVIKAIYKDRATLLLEGQRVIPQKALDSGYKFKFPYLGEALRAIYY